MYSLVSIIPADLESRHVFLADAPYIREKKDIATFSAQRVTTIVTEQDRQHKQLHDAARK